MNRLISELTRLYFLPDQEWLSWQPDENGERVYMGEGKLTPEILAERLMTGSNLGLSLVSSQGMLRTLVICIDRGCYWEQLAALYQAVQEDLDLPAPAISVSVEDGYQLWFSLAEPVPSQQAQFFLNALRLKYLVDIPLSRLKFRPAIEACANAESLSVLPLMQTLTEPAERWSAFIDPTMGSMFVDESWLEMAPNLDKQAAMLAGVESIKSTDFQRVLTLLQEEAALSASLVESSRSGRESGPQGVATDPPLLSSGVRGNFSDPKSFLMAVMNDPQTCTCDRIEAAKALLPYFANLKV
ncbi:MAG: hypothetical protein HGA71_09160 [Azonexaceae bacterium]|nr:hypothetical protein [Azonexaceae bacterium]